MSGHSKWSQIKRQKGATDIKRGQIFSKLTRAIILAARKGSDPRANFQLKIAIDKARQANMPKENIERAIKRGTGEQEGAMIEEILYEAIIPGGIGIIIEAATDNKNRTTAAIKDLLNQSGGKLVSSGSVAYQFQRMGKFILDLSQQNEEELELKVIDAGAQDFEEQGKELAVYTKAEELEKVKRNLEKQGLEVKDPTLTWEPKNLIPIADREIARKTLKLMEILDNHPEITALHTNFDISKELLDIFQRKF